MKKLGLKICIALALFLFVSLFVGCAKTGEGDIFRFEVRELELTVGDSRNLKLVLGEQSLDTEINLIISEVGSDPFNSDASNVLDVITLEKTTINSGESIKVTAEKEGSVYLTAYVKDNENINDTIIVTVNKEKLTALTAIPTKDVLNITETAQFTVTTYPNHISSAVTYSSSDENVGTITADGLFTALNIGSTIITVTSVYDSSVVAVKEMTVAYNDTTEIKLETEENVEMFYTEEYQIQATALPNVYPTLANPNLEFVSSNEEVITVSETGLVKAVGVGDAVVTVKSVDGVEKEISFIVSYAPGTEIVVLNGDDAIENNGTLEVTTDTKKVTLKISVNPDNADQEYLCETSDDGTVITVTEKGIITVKGVGQATITIYSGELLFEFTLVVIEPAVEPVE